MSKHQKTPTFTKEQVDYLNRLYPEKCPDPKATDREIWMQVGQRQVVRHIEAKFKEMQDEQFRGLQEK